jgi:hypothetical protein
MQSFQQIPINFQQQYEVWQFQPANLRQTYNTQFPPLNYQQGNPQQLYNSHFPPLSHQHNETQAAVTSQIESDDDLELEVCSDEDTQESVHEWQSVDETKKRKRDLNQKNDDITKQTYINTSNKFEVLSQKMGTIAMNKQNQIPNSYLNKLLSLYTVF